MMMSGNGNISIHQQIIASSAGAIITSIFVTPMDVVKIRLQSQMKPVAEGECFLFSNGLMDHLCTRCRATLANINGSCEWYNRPGHFNGTFDAFVKISKNEGIRSLWSGLSPTIISAIPATVLYFTLYDNLLFFTRRRFTKNKIFAPLVSGTLARAAVVSVISPLELVRTKMQSEKLSYKELKNAVKRTVTSSGYTSLWKGCSATLMRDIPFSGIYWSFYELLKQNFLKKFDMNQINFFLSFVSGAISGAVAATLTLPFDVIKTHKQIELGLAIKNGNGSLSTNGKLSTLDQSTFVAMQKLVEKKGLSSLFTGMFPRAIKVSLACGIMISSYEYLKNVFSIRNKKLID